MNIHAPVDRYPERIPQTGISGGHPRRIVVSHMMDIYIPDGYDIPGGGCAILQGFQYYLARVVDMSAKCTKQKPQVEIAA